MIGTFSDAHVRFDERGLRMFGISRLFRPEMEVEEHDSSPTM